MIILDVTATRQPLSAQVETFLKDDETHQVLIKAYDRNVDALHELYLTGVITESSFRSGLYKIRSRIAHMVGINNAR